MTYIEFVYYSKLNQNNFKEKCYVLYFNLTIIPQYCYVGLNKSLYRFFFFTLTNPKVGWNCHVNIVE